MTEQKGEGKNHAGAHQHILDRLPHSLVASPLIKLLKERVLVGSRLRFIAFPFAHRDRMDADKLRKLGLVQAKPVA